MDVAHRILNYFALFDLLEENDCELIIKLSIRGIFALSYNF